VTVLSQRRPSSKSRTPANQSMSLTARPVTRLACLNPTGTRTGARKARARLVPQVMRGVMRTFLRDRNPPGPGLLVTCIEDASLVGKPISLVPFRCTLVCSTVHCRTSRSSGMAYRRDDDLLWVSGSALPISYCEQHGGNALLSRYNARPKRFAANALFVSRIVGPYLTVAEAS